MKHPNQKNSFCEETPADCHFEVATFLSGTTVCNDTDINYLIFCHTGHARISSTLFHDEILCAGEVMFIPRQSEYSGTALSDVTLLVHKFNNTVCSTEKCILSYLYSHRQVEAKIYCLKLDARASIRHLVDGIAAYIQDETHDNDLWKLKHKELIWVFTRYYSAEELRSFFHPMTDEQVPFKSLVLTHYRKAEFTDKLAEMCGYGLHNFRKVFKKEFGMSPYKWLVMKRAENIKYRLSQTYIPFVDIIDEFNFSSAAHFTTFCKQYLGNTPTNLRESLSAKGRQNVQNVSQSENVRQ